MYRNPRRNRRLSAFLAVCYGFAGIIAGLMHDHQEPDSLPVPAAFAGRAADAHFGAVHDDSEHSSQHRCPAEGSPCAICKFLQEDSAGGRSGGGRYNALSRRRYR